MEPDTWAKRFREWGALLISAAIYALFAYSLWKSANNPELISDSFKSMQETVKNLALLAAGYWLGSSAQSQRNQEHAAAQQSETMKQLANSVPAQLVLPAPLKPAEVPVAPVVPDIPAKPAEPREPAPMRPEL
jgi:hypothetical protein